MFAGQLWSIICERWDNNGNSFVIYSRLIDSNAASDVDGTWQVKIDVDVSVHPKFRAPFICEEEAKTVIPETRLATNREEYEEEQEEAVPPP